MQNSRWPYLEVVFERNDGCIYCLVCEFREFTKAIQKCREIRRKQLELLWEVLEVELIEFHASRTSTTFQRIAQSGEPAPASGKRAPAHQRVPLGTQNLAWVQVRRVLTEKKRNLSEAIAELEYGGEDGDRASKLPGCVDAGPQLVRTSSSCEQSRA